ncbi:MAG TPA: PQQ-binding-like beta-propeller repeat protein [Pirellulales bacterium]|jgi:outer membrane protein assembly factor BamB|nr:PQQ-binding-like beta-propeller repeat protein [Pirellulales bacterium]
MTVNHRSKVMRACPRQLPRWLRTIALGFVVSISLCLAAAVATGQDWPQFRGPNSDGAIDAAAGYMNFDKGLTVGWKVDLPGRGPSSPIVIGDKVVVTASSGVRQDLLHVLAFGAADGHLLWERQFWATGRTLTHPQTANAAPTPVSDGRNIFAFFSSNDLIALDLDGNLLWYRGFAQDFPRLGNDVGMASSPLVVGETVVVQAESQGEAFVAGIDTGDGSTRWQLEREHTAIWTSPAVLRDASGATAVLVESIKSVSAIDPATGSVLWNHAQDCETIPSACAVAGLVLVPGKGLTALRAGAKPTTPEVAWKNNQITPGAASPTVTKDLIYVLNRGGVLIIADVAEGRIRSRTRLEGNFWSSPVVAGDRLLAVSFEGVGQLVEVSDDGRAGKAIAKIPFGETIQASPAVSADAVFVRGDGHLWKLVAGAEKQP